MSLCCESTRKEMRSVWGLSRRNGVDKVFGTWDSKLEDFSPLKIFEPLWCIASQLCPIDSSSSHSGLLNLSDGTAFGIQSGRHKKSCKCRGVATQSLPTIWKISFSENKAWSGGRFLHSDLKSTSKIAGVAMPHCLCQFQLFTTTAVRLWFKSVRLCFKEPKAGHVEHESTDFTDWLIDASKKHATCPISTLSL